jgi:hypothetical protein
MVSLKGWKQMHTPTRFEYWLGLVSSIAVTIGVVFAGAQLWQNRELERKKNSIELTNLVHSKDFNLAYKRVIEQRARGDKDANRIIDDLNYVVSVYDHIAIMYFNDVLDRNIVEENLGDFLPEINESLTFFGYPEKGMRNIVRLMNNIKRRREQ